MNPSVDVGACRDPLGISAWRSTAHRILVRVKLPFILHWFKNRLPAITNLAGRLSKWMLGDVLVDWQEGSRKKMAGSLQPK